MAIERNAFQSIFLNPIALNLDVRIRLATLECNPNQTQKNKIKNLIQMLQSEINDKKPKKEKK